LRHSRALRLNAVHIDLRDSSLERGDRPTSSWRCYEKKTAAY